MRNIVIALLLVCTSCTKVFIGDDIKSTPQKNFDYLWNTLDQKYSFFEYKNIDWDEVYVRYKSKISDNMSDDKLFEIFFQMLAELKDAHVNLTAPFNMTRYEEVFTKGPENFNNRLIFDNYLLDNYGITGPFKHQSIRNGTVGYIRYESFSDDMSSSDIDYVINKYKNLNGIIFDVRNNGGGYVSNVFTLCQAFADQKRHVYTSYIKTGPEHEDFSEPHHVYLGPASSNIFTKPICILTNRSCFSATSFFVLAMKAFPNVTIVGDTTGGGLGAPTGAELPNGWSFRFSCTRTLSPDGINYENGIPPDVVKYLRTSDVNRGVDSIIEAAIYEIYKQSR